MKSTNRQSGIRLNRSTIAEMRLAAAEMSVAQGEPFNSDDQRIMALVDHWHRTKPMPAELLPSPQQVVPGQQPA